jgi:hypothetical protein
MGVRFIAAGVIIAQLRRVMVRVLRTVWPFNNVDVQKKVARSKPPSQSFRSHGCPMSLSTRNGREPNPFSCFQNGLRA